MANLEINSLANINAARPLPEIKRRRVLMVNIKFISLITNATLPYSAGQGAFEKSCSVEYVWMRRHD
ncbi:hypothetical protein [Candidatus Spongiihabitans sp.]|uniref:hypothetical protein n=1 Tax=Candidatus Spongiihabitans sp. TaxID=3101308 RepID=UPI003C7E1C80